MNHTSVSQLIVVGGDSVCRLVGVGVRGGVTWHQIYDERRTARRGASAVAGDFTSPHNLTYEEKVVRGSDSRICAQKASGGIKAWGFWSMNCTNVFVCVCVPIRMIIRALFVRGQASAKTKKNSKN